MKTLHQPAVGAVARATAATAFLAAACCAPAQASITATASRGAIGPGYVVNWASLGPDQTAVTSPFTLGQVTVNGGTAFSVFTGATFSSDFNVADSVLSLFSLPTLTPLAGTFNITFASAVVAAGAQVQGGAFGSFSGTLAAYNASNVLLGSGAISGSNGGNANGSAVFVGLISSAADIKRMEFTVSGVGAGINLLSVATVPEPAAWLSLLAGMAGVTGLRRRRRG